MDSNFSHSRYNPLSDRWVLTSPHRIQRPWSGEETSGEKYKFKEDNSLCPGAIRSSGIKNPDYKDVFVFENDFPAYNCPFDKSDGVTEGLLKTRMEYGECKVICYHPNEKITIPKMSIEHVQKVVKSWIEVYEQMEATGKFGWIQIFENRGSMMGCSNPSPHCQVWASRHMPCQIEIKDKMQLRYFEQHESPLLYDYARLEMEKGSRIVLENADFICLVPFWAEWPYETMILPKTKIDSIKRLNETEIASFSEILQTLITKYDNLFKTTFPYSMGVFGSPPLEEKTKHWTMHLSFYPPLLRSASIKKHMVGYEMFAQAQRDITPEKAAERLKEIDGSKPYDPEV